jgi:exopolysaccharide production protein ExoZ
MGVAREQLVSIQYLRAIAALMVVLHHAVTPKEWLFNPLEGYPAFAWGVDIFFVISGFIMYFAARDEKPFAFLRQRIIRVVPLYWGATAAFLVIDTRFHIFSLSLSEISHVLKSLAFIPHYNLSRPSMIEPYLVPGWTLNYEMFFYFIFFVSLTCKRVMTVVTVSVLGLFFSGIFVDFNNAILKAYTHPILLEFLAGALVGYLYVNKLIPKNTWWLLPAGFSGLLSLPLIDDHNLILTGRTFFSTMILYGAISMGNDIFRSSIMNLLGDASYSIYLTHSVVSLGSAKLLWKQLAIERWGQFTGWVILSLGISVVVGIIVYRYIERPALIFFRSTGGQPRSGVN